MVKIYRIARGKIFQGDALEVLKKIPEGSVQCCVTSPPYWGLRDYGIRGQIGLETTPEAYVEKLVTIFREVRRILKKDGVLWLNLGDTYSGNGQSLGQKSKNSSSLQLTNKGSLHHRQSKTPPVNRNVFDVKSKELVSIPWRVAFALQADGWFLRSDVIWHKSNAMPESVTDRPTKSHEYIFILTKDKEYFFFYQKRNSHENREYAKTGVRMHALQLITKKGTQSRRKVKSCSKFSSQHGE